MSYTRTIWRTGETPLSAGNMNNIEDGVEEALDGVEEALAITRRIAEIVYPVGCYFETTDTSFDPNTAFGGTWVLETGGQVHVSAGSGYAISGALTNRSDGGSKDAIVPYHTHSTSVTQPTFTIPNHTHTGYFRQDNRVGGDADRLGHSGSYDSYGITITPPSGGGGACTRTTNVAVSVAAAGVAVANKNMQPYIVVNRWHRTA